MTLFQSFKRYLEKEGIPIEKGSNSESLLLFKKDLFYYAFTYNDSDPHYFRLLLPNIWKCEGQDLEFIYKKALEVSAEYKIGKFGIVDNCLWASFEQLILDTNANNVEIFACGIIMLEMMCKEIKKIIKTHQEMDKNDVNDEHGQLVVE